MFTIDEAKVQQVMNTNPVPYFITASNLLEFEIPKTTVYTVDFTAPAEMIDPAKYLSELRERVVASGISLKSPKEIDREIAEMRRHDL